MKNSSASLYGPENALLVGIRRPRQTREEAFDSLQELQSLADTAGAQVRSTLFADLKKIDPATFIGSGKVREIEERIKTENCNIVIFDEELSPSQQRNLEQALKTKIVDRTGLILDIFAQRARTKEGKLQVELAQLLYLSTRLVGKGGQLSQQTGGIGTRGPGETQLEMDRRRMREKIHRIGSELEKVKASRKLHRTKRQSIPIPTVSLIGYTNAGKSTLFKTLTEAEVLVEDKLFATLDPTVRRLKLPSGREILLADTVGFIQKLPHALVESFKATFEEIAGSELLVHVIDVSRPNFNDQREEVLKVLGELKLDQKPILEVYNKIDLLGAGYTPPPKGIYLSAARKQNIHLLLERLDSLLAKGFRKLVLQIPFSKGELIDFLHRNGRVLAKEFSGDGVRLEVEVYHSYVLQLKPFKVG